MELLRLALISDTCLRLSGSIAAHSDSRLSDYLHRSIQLLGIAVAPDSQYMSLTNRRKALIISNPLAGRNHRSSIKIEKFQNRLSAHGIDSDLCFISKEREGRMFVRKAFETGATDIVVSGGDGTINEVLQGMVGTSIRLGIWARGTANVLAYELKLPFQAKAAADVIARGKTRKIHIGCAISEETGERRYFLLMAGIGLDASIVQRVRAGLKRRAGEAAYWFSGIEHLMRWPPAPFKVEVDGTFYTATFAAIGNAAHYGGNLSVTPRASLDIPEFEICLVNSRSRAQFIFLLSQARLGGARVTGKAVRFMSAKRARATGDAMVQADGELIGKLPMSFEIAHECLEVIVPG